MGEAATPPASLLSQGRLRWRGFLELLQLKAQLLDWKKEHARLWATLVPRSGQAATLQGELVRIAGKLTDEAYRNGNGNWDEACERMWRFVARHLDDPLTFTPDERAEVREAVEAIIADRDRPDLSGDGSLYYLVDERVIDWCMAHPYPIPHAADPSLWR